MSTFCADLARALRVAQVQPPRTYREFFEHEITIPTGKFRGLPFDCDVQPITALLLEQLGEPRWNEIVITGPSQSGKTTIGFTGPLLYVAAELAEPVVVGLPDLAMAGDKWQVDIEPILQASPTLRRLIPEHGPGSRGGKITDSIKLANGAMIKFMTRGGSDQSKAGFPGCRFLRVTEAAGFSHARATSVEADPLRQIRARLSSYDLEETQTIIEGTVTLEGELPWRLWQQSSQSRILSPCPHCGGWISPERDDFRGWETAANELEAAELGAFYCPACGESIDDDQRRESLRSARLVHQGQTITKAGRIRGQPPATSRLWFRWSAWHNCLVSARTLAAREWAAAQIEEETREREDAERELCQFVWCLPYEPPQLTVAPLTVADLDNSATPLERGLLPADTEALTVGVDVGMYWSHWVAIAWRESRSGHVVDYQRLPVLEQGQGSAPSRKRAVKLVLRERLLEFCLRCRQGWQVSGQADRLAPDRVWIDAGYLEDVIFSVCCEQPDAFMPAFGRGTGQLERTKYSHPTRTDRTVRLLGERYHVRRSSKHRRLYVIADADYWKTQLTDWLQVDAEGEGALTLFSDVQNRHKTFKRHLTAEELTREVHPRHGAIDVWRNPQGKPNHYFDACYLAAAAGHHAGYRLVASSASEPPKVSRWWSK